MSKGQGEAKELQKKNYVNKEESKNIAIESRV